MDSTEKENVSVRFESQLVLPRSVGPREYAVHWHVEARVELLALDPKSRGDPSSRAPEIVVRDAAQQQDAAQRDTRRKPPT